MKRIIRPLALAMLFVALTVGAYAAVSGDGPVSLSYLTNTFFPQAEKAGNEAAEKALQETYSNAISQLEQGSGQGEGGIGGLYSSDLRSQGWYDGQTLGFGTGCGILMLEGCAVVDHNGAVVDVTNGTEISSGSILAPNHRYLVGEDTLAHVTIQSGYATLGIQGSYTLSGESGSAAPFFDVKRTDWYYVPVNYVCEKNLFSGMSEHTFGPAEPMTRAMLMTVLYQMAGAPSNEMAAADVTLTDVPENAWYAPYVKWGVSQGIASGTGAGTFTPNGQVTREQVIVMLYSFAANYLGQSTGAAADLSAYQDAGQVSPWAYEAMSWAVAQGVVSGSSEGGAMKLNPQHSANRAEVAAMLRSFDEKI